MGEKLDAAWAQAKAMPGALSRDVARDVGNSYQMVLLGNSSLSMVHQPGSTQVELANLHNTVDAPEAESESGIEAPEIAAPGNDGPDMD
jgi:hypothetical protein